VGVDYQLGRAQAAGEAEIGNLRCYPSGSLSRCSAARDSGAQSRLSHHPCGCGALVAGLFRATGHPLVVAPSVPWLSRERLGSVLPLGAPKLSWFSLSSPRLYSPKFQRVGGSLLWSWPPLGADRSP
jgi:hypothetical protein